MEALPASRPNRATIPAAVRLLLLADATMVALYVLDAALGHPSWTLTRLVDLDGEGNLPTWYSSGQLLALALLLGAFAVARSGRITARSLPIFSLSAICLAMSLDEVAQIHEWLGEKSDVLFATGTRQGSLVPRTGVWMFLLGPPFVVVVALLWRALSSSLRGRGPVRRLFLAGFFTYAVSALGIEILANAVRPGGLASMLQVICEELGEMVGVTLLVWAAIELLRSHDIRLRAGP